jgi:hypothetical protein
MFPGQRQQESCIVPLPLIDTSFGAENVFETAS